MLCVNEVTGLLLSDESIILLSDESIIFAIITRNKLYSNMQTNSYIR